MFAEKYEPVLAVLLALKGEPRHQKSGPNFSFISNKENLPGASGFFERGEIALTGGEAALRCVEWSSNILGPNSQHDKFQMCPFTAFTLQAKVNTKKYEYVFVPRVSARRQQLCISTEQYQQRKCDRQFV